MELHGKCIICKKGKNLVAIGTFSKCCKSCAKKLNKADNKKLMEYSRDK